MTHITDAGLIKLEHDHRIARMNRDIAIQHDPRLKPRRRARPAYLLQLLLRALS